MAKNDEFAKELRRRLNVRLHYFVEELARDELILLDYGDGKSVADICKKHKIWPAQFYRIMRYYGLHDHKRNTRHKLSFEQKELLAKIGESDEVFKSGYNYYKDYPYEDLLDNMLKSRSK